MHGNAPIDMPIIVNMRMLISANLCPTYCHVSSKLCKLEHRNSLIFPKVAVCIPPGSCGRHVRSAPHVDAMSTTRAEWPRNGSVVLAMQPCREMDQGLVANYY
jgi:hypothetical protein